MKNEKNNTDRRKFIKKAAMYGGGIIATTTSPIFTKLLFATEKPEKEGYWWGIGIDLEKCIGCGNCVRACKRENNVSLEPFYFRTWVEQYTINNKHEIKVESPNGGFWGFNQSVPTEDIYKSFFVPKMCNHCYKSPCEQVCPVGATYRTDDGVVLIDKTYCIGCKYCIQACPYGCRYIDPDSGVIDKCTLCYHRLSKGRDTACVEMCPTGTRIYGDLNDPESVISIFRKEHITHVLKPHLNTGCKLYYNALNEEVR